jgi:hypothetical protein
MGLGGTAFGTIAGGRDFLFADPPWPGFLPFYKAGCVDPAALLHAGRRFFPNLEITIDFGDS